MADDREFRVRPGRPRSTRIQAARPFIAQALAAARRAGGGAARSGRITPGNRSRFGHGGRASIEANRFITTRTRGAVVKARVVRHTARSAPLATHLAYLRRDGVTRDGNGAQLFGPGPEEVDANAFAGRGMGDRHHFRFIVSPDDAPDLGDLRSFTRDLVEQMEKDLDTKLDWAAIDHWNTAHPHVHLIVRGVRDDGHDLVIARDYIKAGLRDRARDLVTQELGPRTDLDIRRSLESQIHTERWTQLDRQLVRDAAPTGFIDLASGSGREVDPFHLQKVGRLRTLEVFGLAGQIGHLQWAIAPEAETVLRELGERGDIIKRMNRALTSLGIERSMASYVVAAERLDAPILGRLIERGLDDEFKETAYALVDGVDGRTHHIRFPNLDAAGDGPLGSIVELRSYDTSRGDRRMVLAVRSDLDLAAQVSATGATWLDRQAVARGPDILSAGGFGADVRQALDQRAEHLIANGLAERRGGRVVFARRLLETLRRREVAAVGEDLAARSGLPFKPSGDGDHVSGVYRQRLVLASGRFAMIEDGMGFQLVPWSPSLDRQIGRHVRGLARGDGGIDWDEGRRRGLGL